MSAKGVVVPTTINPNSCVELCVHIHLSIPSLRFKPTHNTDLCSHLTKFAPRDNLYPCT